jgi:hypothetical protein
LLIRPMRFGIAFAAFGTGELSKALVIIAALYSLIFISVFRLLERRAVHWAGRE